MSSRGWSCRVGVPATRYARSGDLQIAYQVVGGGPPDIVVVPTYLSNIEMHWDLPFFARFYERLSSSSRLILFDRRCCGMSDDIAGATPLEEQIDDVQAVISAVSSEHPALASSLEGCGLAALYAGLTSRPRAGTRPDLAAGPSAGRSGV